MNNNYEYSKFCGHKINARFIFASLLLYGLGENGFAENNDYQNPMLSQNYVLIII